MAVIETLYNVGDTVYHRTNQAPATVEWIRGTISRRTPTGDGPQVEVESQTEVIYKIFLAGRFISCTESQLSDQVPENVV